MILDPNNPFDLYFALRLAFVDRPGVRIRLQEAKASPGSDRFAPDPTLWPLEALAYHDGDDPVWGAQSLQQIGSLDRSFQEAGVGAQALCARDVWETGATLGPRAAHQGSRFAAEVLLGETPA